jgi:glycine/D-amino acid oxidase-like deaminating enzyme
LLGADPALRVLVIERETVGFGASGRNGGWCVGELAGGLDGAVRAYGAAEGVRLTRAIIAAVDEVAGAVEHDAIECGFVRGGVLRLARTAPQLERQRHEIAEYEAHGLGDVMRTMTADEARWRLAATDVLGGLYYAAGARVQPARLVAGLAAAAERRGATIVEHTAARRIDSGVGPLRPCVVTDRGTVRADVVVCATEAYTRDLDGRRRDVVPLYSRMIATEPLPAEVWAEIGLADRETFADDRRMVIYGQRTTDDRIAFGGRGAPYRFGSGIDEAAASSSAIHERLARTLIELFPVLDGVAITHRWGGVLGVPRDWRPSVGLDRTTGVAWAGGYVGEGVAASNLAGRTLADLITGAASDLTTLAWVGHRSRRWEPEPLRWIGINGGLRLAGVVDDSEERRGRTSRAASVLDRIVR